MSVLVGTLAVDVVNGQATFTLDEAKSQLDSFGKKAEETGQRVSYSMRESRESLMAVGDMFGVHLPASITRTIAGLGPLGPALEAALPFAAVALGATLLIEHIIKVREEAEKLAQAQVGFGTSTDTVFNNLDDKLLEAGVKADELAGNHLAALHKQIELIDHATLKDLVSQFDVLSKAADAVFAQLKESWYESGQGSRGAANALVQFKSQYDSLIAKGETDKAHGLLTGTLDQAKQAFELMNAQQGGHGSDEKELAAQQTLVDTLNAQLVVEQKLAALDKAQAGNAIKEADNKITTDTEHQYRVAAEAAQKAANDEEKAREQAARQDLEIARGEEQETIKLTQQGSQARIAAIESAIKLEQSMYQTYTEYYKNLIVERQRAVEAADNKEVSDLQKKIGAQDKYNESIAKEAEAKIKGAFSGAETDVKDKASLGLITKREEQQQLQNIYTSELQDLLTLYAREITAAEQHSQQMKALAASLPSGSEAQANALREAQNEQDRMNKLVAQGAQIQTQLNRAIAETQTAGQHLQSSWQNYFQKMNTETKDLGTTIRENLQGSITQLTNGFANAMSKSIVEGKNLGKSMKEVAAQILESMVSMLIRWVEQWIISHTVMAAIGTASATATAKAQGLAAAGLAGANMTASFAAAPWPIDMGAPAAGAAAMSAALGFLAAEQGAIVPGYGIGDTVPAMLTPGEMVLPKPISQGLQGAIQNGGLGGETHYHAPTFAPQVTAFDSAGVNRVIQKHADKFRKEFKAQTRRRNK